MSAPAQDGAGADPMSSDESSTQTTAPPSSTAPDAGVQRQARLRIAACSDKGLVRKNNEDRYLALKVTRSTTSVLTNIDAAQLQFVPEQTRWSLVVADGMGGHAAGEVASTLALTLAVKLAQQGTQWFVEIGDQEAKAVIERVETIMTTVDRAIAQQSRQQARLKGMGTTMTVAIIVTDQLFTFHVGDSRCYLLRKGHLQRLTRDQTMTQQLVDAGLLPPEALHTHTMRHVLTQAMGTGDVVIEAQHLQVEQGDRLLLASDGLTDGVSDEEIELILSSDDCDAACKKLMHGALAAGGRDNITVIVADVEFESDANAGS
jgi:PPM family protein phosphatase